MAHDWRLILFTLALEFTHAVGIWHFDGHEHILAAALTLIAALGDLSDGTGLFQATGLQLLFVHCVFGNISACGGKGATGNQALDKYCQRDLY